MHASSPPTPITAAGRGRSLGRAFHALSLSPRVDVLLRVAGVLGFCAVAAVLGAQFVDPNTRVIQVIAAVLIFGAAWKLDTLSGLCLLLLALPFPRGTSYGSTNIAFILLMLLVWLLRITQLKQSPPRRTPLDAPIVGLLMAYTLSFYNIAKPAYVPWALLNTSLVLASLVLFYMIVNNVRRSADLERLLNFQAFSILLVCLLSIWELNHPFQAFIPGWIDFRHSEASLFGTKGVRVGGPFFDYELLAEYSATSLLLVTYLFLRARSQTRRWMYGLLWLMVLFILFATVTRGAFVALAAGVVYLLWVLRRRISFVKLVLVSGFVVGSVVAMNYYVANFTRSADLLVRLSGSKFRGLIPETRVGIWDVAFERWLEHPLLGHGPYYSLEKGLTYWPWPHNVYLYYANIVGMVGLGFFLWLLWRLWRLSKPRTDDLFHANFATGFLVIGHAMLFVFIVDQVKIDYLRNSIYQVQVWVMFALIVSAHRVSRHEVAPAQELPSLPRAA